MKTKVNVATVVVFGTVFFAAGVRAQSDAKEDGGARKAVVQRMSGADDSLSEQDRQMLETAESLAAACTSEIESWVRSNAISEEKMFSYLYYPIPGTSPPKFHTDYDAFSDKEIQGHLEKHLKSSPDLLYAVMADRNGYVPTHNLAYSQPLTGDPVKDLSGNRTKRIYADRVGLAAARNTEPYLFQSYKRDTGQTITDLSVPIVINGRHWGNVRLGYLRAQ